MLKAIDAHWHGDLYQAAERHALLMEAFASGVTGVVTVSMNLDSCKRNHALARRYGRRVLPAYGLHPEQPLPPAAEVERLLDWIRERHRAKEHFAIGEVGLPYYMRSEAEAAGKVFNELPYVAVLEQFVALATELDRPLVLHAVYEDAEKACELLERYNVRRAHFHWFKGSEETAQKMAAAGYCISFTPDLAYEPEIQRLAASYPIRQIMAETDGPWPFAGPFKGRTTAPVLVHDVVASYARLQGIELRHAAERLATNAREFYWKDRGV